QRLGKGATEPVEKFKANGADFVVADSLDELFAGMRRLSPDVELDTREIKYELEARDRELDNTFSKDAQITARRGARRNRGDRVYRFAKPQKYLDRPSHPRVAVRLHVLTRETLGGIQTDLSARALGADGKPIPGLYAVGEVGGFG